MLPSPRPGRSRCGSSSFRRRVDVEVVLKDRRSGGKEKGGECSTLFGARMESTGSPYWCSKRRQGSQKWQIDANGLKTLNEDHLENKGDGGGVYPFLQSSKTSLQLGCLLFLEVMKFWLNEVKCHIRRWPLPAGRPGKSGLCPAATESRWRRWAKQLGCVRVRSGLSGVGRGKAQTRLMTGTDWHIYIH